MNSPKLIFAIFWLYGCLFPETGSALFQESPVSERIGRQLKQIEDKLLVHINTARNRAGLAPVFTHEELSRIAKKHSEEMKRTGLLNHNLTGQGNLAKRLSKARISFVSFGENLARSNIPVPAFIHDQFMQSPAHRENILNPRFTHCGISISPEKKSFFVTVTFIQSPIPGSQTEAEFLLKEDLESWYINRFNDRFLYHLPSQDRIRKLAERRSDRLPENRDSVHTLTVVDHDLENLKRKLKQEIEKISLEALSLGVNFESRNRLPARRYSLAALLFGTYYSDLPPPELEKILLNSLNRIRARTGSSNLRLDDRLNRKADHRLKSFSGKTPRKENDSDYRFLIFRLTNPRLVPPEIEEYLAVDKNETGRVGISVRVTSRDHSLPDQLLFCLIYPR